MRDILFEIAGFIQEELRKHKGEDLSEEVGMGADGSPTSRIDLIAENCVFDILKKHDNPLNVLSEESEFVDNGAEYTLVVDPVDGTFNALRHIPFYSVSLAVGKKNLSDIEYGLVRDLLRGTTYYSEKGMGAFLDGKPIGTSEYDEAESLFLVYGGRLAKGRATAIAQMARRTRSYGAASLEMCMVASGQADLYYVECEPMLRIIDIAAGTLIVREAGGMVLDLQGENLNMDLDIKERSNLMVLGDSKLLEAIL